MDKATAVKKLLDHRAASAQETDNIVVRDLERDYVKPLFENDLAAYLDANELHQRMQWKQAWSNFIKEHGDDEHDVLLCMHGVLARQLYGVRALAITEDLRAFAPTHIITLIDDVYMKWHRTESRAGQLDYVGRPTLSQLIDARRAELLVGDFISRNVHQDRPLTNILLAVRHPARLLDRLVFSNPTGLLPVYLSFPISGPRKRLAKGDDTGIKSVNDFLERAYEIERATARVAFFCPLSIDELPLGGVYDSSKKEPDEVTFDLDARWSTDGFFKNDILLTDPLPSEISLVNRQVRDSIGMIHTDVAVRDYRLVTQSRRILVFNPSFDRHISRGVENEILCAIESRRPIHIYQDPQHDPEGIAKTRFKPSQGSLGLAPGRQYITFHDSLDAAFEAVVAD